MHSTDYIGRHQPCRILTTGGVVTVRKNACSQVRRTDFTFFSFQSMDSICRRKRNIFVLSCLDNSQTSRRISRLCIQAAPHYERTCTCRLLRACDSLKVFTELLLILVRWTVVIYLTLIVFLVAPLPWIFNHDLDFRMYGQNVYQISR